MKSVTITLKDETLKGDDVHKIATRLSDQGLKISSVQPYGVITGHAEDDLIERFKQNKQYHVNENPPVYKAPPMDSDIQ